MSELSEIRKPVMSESSNESEIRKLRGFGFEYNVENGTMRHWFINKNGDKEYLDGDIEL